MRGARLRWRVAALLPRLLLLVLLAACASGLPPPAWQGDTQQAMEAAIAAHFAGDAAGASRQFERVRSLVSSTGNPALLARAELMRCAADVASLAFEPCAGFERLRVDADPAERAYAEYLAGRAVAADVALLPPAQQAVARHAGRPEAARAALQDVADPLSRLVAAAVLLRRGEADPQAVAIATDTASAQGWRRPLLAWLGVQLGLAERGGRQEEAARLRRRIALAGGAQGQ